MQIDNVTETVVKSNDLIQSRHGLSLTEQKAILYVISKIKRTDTELEPYEFSLKDFCAVCGYDRSGRAYSEIRAMLKGLRDRSWWQQLPDGSEVTCSWLAKVKLDYSAGSVLVELDRDLKPHLLQLKQKFTEYQLKHCLAFRSRYSMRLYEFVCSIHFHPLESLQWNFTLEKLREVLGAEHYTAWKSLKQRALDVAVQEINTYSNKRISYTCKKQGRSVVGIELFINPEDGIETLQSEIRANQRLYESEQLEGQQNLFDNLGAG